MFTIPFLIAFLISFALKFKFYVRQKIARGCIYWGENVPAKNSYRENIHNVRNESTGGVDPCLVRRVIEKHIKIEKKIAKKCISRYNEGDYRGLFLLQISVNRYL